MSEIKVLMLLGSLRASSINRQLAELGAESAPDGVRLQLFDRLGELPFYNEDTDNDQVAEPVIALREAAAAADAALVVTPEIQRQHSRCAEERDRLAVAALRAECARRQTGGRYRGRGRPHRRGVGTR